MAKPKINIEPSCGLHACFYEWTSKLAYVKLAINSTINVSTGFAPFQLLYGANVKLPLDHIVHAPDIDPGSAIIAHHIT